MSAKITVNGVTYDSVDALPPEARRVYDQALANMPEFASRNGDGTPAIVEGTNALFQNRTVVRKKFVVNGQSYDDESAMPADARAAIEQAKHLMESGDPSVKKNEIHMSFQLTGPGFTWRKEIGTPTSTSAPRSLQAPPSGGTPTPRPIEPDPIEGRLHLAIVLAACAAAGFLVWLVSRVR